MMRDFMGFTRRNILLYFKDVLAILFSLLTSVIVFVLYILFLKGTFVEALTSTMNGLENIVNSNDIDMFVNGILLSGILGSAMITVPYTCLQTIVKDRETGVDSDICATPLKRWKIVLSYFTSSAVSSFVITAAILTIGLAVLSFSGDLHLSAAGIVSAYGIVLLGCVSSTALFMPVMLMFRNSANSNAFFGILSAAGGFLIGAYIPLSQFSDSIQSFCNLFPATHITSLIKSELLKGIAQNMDRQIAGLDNGLFISKLKESFSFQARAFGTTFESTASILYVAAVAAVCIVLMTAVYNKTYRRK